MISRFLIGSLLITHILSCSTPAPRETLEKKEVKEPQSEAAPTNKVVLSSEIVWEKLNPARGEKSPKAGTIWGDRKGKVATGFLAKFVDGFSSPPHIHNVTYRAVVIEGKVHNDDPKAENMWMVPGSFWTQPKGEAHITSAKGEVNIAYVEIDHGPYLVQPTDEAYDSGERPVNIDASNIVWMNHSTSQWIDSDSKAQISFLWETPSTRGVFIQLPAHYSGEIESNGSELHAVVITGEAHYNLPPLGEDKVMDPGSYFTSTGVSTHRLSNTQNEAAVIYVRTNGELMIH